MINSNTSIEGGFLPFLIQMPDDGPTIPLKGLQGDIVYVATSEDLPLTASFMDYTEY